MAEIVLNGSDDDHRRAPSEGAICALGYAWDDTVKVMFEDYLRSAPELKNRSFIWILRARINGFRIEFYDDDDVFFRRLQAEARAAALNPNGPQVHAGRISKLESLR